MEDHEEAMESLECCRGWLKSRQAAIYAVHTCIQKDKDYSPKAGTTAGAKAHWSTMEDLLEDMQAQEKHADRSGEGKGPISAAALVE